MKHSWLIGFVSGAALVFGTSVIAQDTHRPPTQQDVLGPGMYVFQTRTRAATCGDDERSGYVTSFVAPIEGIPGAATMRMNLLNSPYWTSWSLTVTADGEVQGESFLTGSHGENRPVNRFHVRRDGSRFTGEGGRTYQSTVNGVRRNCEVTFDALLRRIDV